ncbi:MAG: hypothetical protein IPG90_15585 [Bacteroidetes bacterium]|nr:hypothetical protein [Bacteroidota bacterium]
MAKEYIADANSYRECIVLSVIAGGIIFIYSNFWSKWKMRVGNYVYRMSLGSEWGLKQETDSIRITGFV